MSLVSVPVRAYSATTVSSSGISLNQLHEPCHSRIRYEKVCPVHGAVGSDEIVKGYEYAKGQYVVIDTDELEKMRTESDRSITISSFFESSKLDPIYFSGKSYLLTPDGPAGQKPYALLQQAMADERVSCVAQVVLHGREQVVVVRAAERLLCMSTLHYDQDVKKPAEFTEDLGRAAYSDDEMKLTKMLLDASRAEELELAQYEDLYRKRLTELIEAKVEGRELVSPPPEEAPSVINLMDALRASVAEAEAGSAKRASEKKAAGKAAGKAEKKVAPSARKRTTARKGKKKTG